MLSPTDRRERAGRGREPGGSGLGPEGGAAPGFEPYPTPCLELGLKPPPH